MSETRHINQRALSAVQSALARLGLEKHPDYIAVEPDGAGRVTVRVSLPEHYVIIPLAESDDLARVCYHQICKELGYETIERDYTGTDRE